MTKVVYLNDTGIPYENAEAHFKGAAEWAKKQCASFVNYHVQDVSDASLCNDFVAAFKFKNPNDALMFEIKWKSS